MTKTNTPKEPALGPALEFLQRLWRLNHAMERLSSHMDKQLGITAQQRLILRCIGKQPALAPSHLARMLHLDPGTISASLNRLEDRGLLNRKRDGIDKRRAYLSLTAKGRALDVPSEGTVESAVEKLLAGVAAREVTTVLAVLTDLSQKLESEIDHTTHRPKRPRPRRA